MAGNTSDIKRRIKSVTSTGQITKAMELVANAKLRRTKEVAISRRDYTNTMLEMIEEILSYGALRNKYFINKEEEEIKSSLYIVITADRGLAGGFNSNILKLASSSIKNKEKAKIIAIGTKGRDYFKKRGYDLVGEYVGISEDPSYEITAKISQTAINLFNNGIVEEIFLVYSSFISVIKQEPSFIKLLPGSKNLFEARKVGTLEDEIVEEKKATPKAILSFDPGSEDLLNYLIPKYINNVIFGALIENAAGEQASRRIAMGAASDNANEMIGKLTLKYNRVRQTNITGEIIEIVAGAEALK